MISNIALHFLQEHPKDAARILEQFTPEQLAGYLEPVPSHAAAVVLKYIIPSIATECLKAMALDKSSSIIMHLGVERASLLLRRMKSSIRVQFIRSMSPVFANMTRLVLRYPEGTVGQVMDPDIFAVDENMTVDEVIKIIKNSPPLAHNEIFITGDRQQLLGIIDIRRLLIDDGDQTMQKIMQPPGLSIPARSSLASVMNHPQWLQQENIPVIDRSGVFIGILSRTMLHQAQENGDLMQGGDEFTGIALAVAELFWDACANLLVPDSDDVKKGQQNERNE